MKYLFKKLVEIKEEEATAQGISFDEICRYFPTYLQVDIQFETSYLKFKFMKLVLFLLAMGVKIFLLPRKEETGNLDIKEVEKVYNREARIYDWKHHLTTRGMDTVWRRQAGYVAVAYCLNNQQKEVQILDLCTGTGLTVFEIGKILVDRKIKAYITGLDYNRNMLAMARKRSYPFANIMINFVKGNAMELYTLDCTIADTENIRFNAESFDVVTQMCGIGGISNPQSVFEGVLKLLKPGGYFYISDMHRPVINLGGELPVFHKWISMPLFEVLAYESTTIPLVLNRLWGWRDTTLDFYILPLISWWDGNRFWGFETLSFEMESERWWFGLTVMPYAKSVVKKIEITKDEYDKKQKILKLLKETQKPVV